MRTHYRPAKARRATAAAVVAALALFITFKPPAAAPPISPRGEAAPTPAAAVVDDRWEERKARAREDVEYFESYYKARQTECRAAELRIAFTAAYKADVDRQKDKGYVSTSAVKQADIGLAESQSQLELRLVELKNAEIRLARARRRLRTIERSNEADDPEPPTSIEDRCRELEIKFDLLRSELNQLKLKVPAG